MLNSSSDSWYRKVLPILANRSARIWLGWNKIHGRIQGLEISAADWSEKWLPGNAKHKFSVGVAPNLAVSASFSSAKNMRPTYKNSVFFL